MTVETLTIPEYELPESLQAFFDVDTLRSNPPGKKIVYSLQPLSRAAETALKRAIQNQQSCLVHPDRHIHFGIYTAPKNLDPRTWLSQWAFHNIITELEGPYNQFDVTVKRNERGLPSRINQLLS